ncbi:MAG: hypothetical protein ACKVTZ_10380 [Bacteroidia bacterium]
MKQQSQESSSYNPYKLYEEENGIVNASFSSETNLEMKPGLTLTESNLLNRAIFHDTNFALVNKNIYNGQIEGVSNILLLPNEIIYILRDYYIMKMKEQKQVIENRFPLNCFVHGHAITLVGFDIELNCFTFIDTIYPSVLSQDQNNFGVAAIQSTYNDRIWLISSEDLQKVIIAIFIPNNDLQNLIKQLGT